MPAARRSSAPIRKPRVRLRVHDRRQQLLDLGLRAFTAHAYDDVSTDALAAQAGISRGLLFHYFPSKHAYYVAVLGRAADQLVHETVVRHTGSPAVRLDAGLRAYFRFVEEHAAAYATLLRAGVGTDAVVQALVERTRARYIATIRSALGPLVGDARSAGVRAALRGWIGLVEAIALDWVDHRDLERDALVALAVRGLALVVPAAAVAL